jgi:hypothetical protein
MGTSQYAITLWGSGTGSGRCGERCVKDRHEGVPAHTIAHISATLSP